MLTDYIGLERIRYGERLDLQMDIKVEHEDNRLIAPLLLIPFVENCFKHGASKLIGKAWIKLHIETRDDVLHFDLRNNKPGDAAIEQSRPKIGLMNVQKRLQLLYPGKHFLKIESNDKDYWAHMQIALEEQLAPIETGDTIIQPQFLNYA